MNSFRNALSKGLSQVARTAGELVTYRRGTVTAQITATRGFKQAENDGRSNIQSLRHDWIITADQANLSTGTIQPIEGDELEDLAGVIYRVVKDPSDGKCARWMPHNVALRIHTVIASGEQ